MNKLKFKNNKIKIIVMIILIITFIYFYIVTFINTNIKNIIANEINSKYTKTKIDIRDKLLFTSLNKIVSDNDIKTVNNVIENENKIIEIIDEVEKVKEEKNKSTKKIVYIYNTHETESYSLPFVSDYSITPNVKLASYILKDYLNDLGVESYVQRKSIASYLKKHNLDYKGCYEASRYYMKEEFKNNDYKILLDIHRDSVKHKYTLYEKNKKKYAKVMFVLTTKHKNYKKNQKFANILNDKLNKKYKGLSRGILKRNDVIFNQDLRDNAILIELGGVDNTLEEINNTLKVLADIIYEYIKEEKL